MITPIKVILRVELATKKMAGQLVIHLVISILHRRDSLLEESLLLSSIIYIRTSKGFLFDRILVSIRIYHDLFFRQPRFTIVFSIIRKSIS